MVVIHEIEVGVDKEGFFSGGSVSERGGVGDLLNCLGDDSVG